MVVLIGDPDVGAADGFCCLLRVTAVHVHVILVNRCGDWNLVGSKPFRLVEKRPVRIAREDLGGIAQRAQGRILLEHPRIDHLSREEHGGVAFQCVLVAELGKLPQCTLCGPVGLGPLGVDRLMHDRVERVVDEGDASSGLFQEPVRQLDSRGSLHESLFQQIVQCREASWIPQVPP